MNPFFYAIRKVVGFAEWCSAIRDEATTRRYTRENAEDISDLGRKMLWNDETLRKRMEANRARNEELAREIERFKRYLIHSNNAIRELSEYVKMNEKDRDQIKQMADYEIEAGDIVDHDYPESKPDTSPIKFAVREDRRD